MNYISISKQKNGAQRQNTHYQRHSTTLVLKESSSEVREGEGCGCGGLVQPPPTPTGLHQAMPTSGKFPKFSELQGDFPQRAERARRMGDGVGDGRWGWGWGVGWGVGVGLGVGMGGRVIVESRSQDSTSAQFPVHNCFPH